MQTTTPYQIKTNTAEPSLQPSKGTLRLTEAHIIIVDIDLCGSDMSDNNGLSRSLINWIKAKARPYDAIYFCTHRWIGTYSEFMNRQQGKLAPLAIPQEVKKQWMLKLLTCSFVNNFLAATELQEKFKCVSTVDDKTLGLGQGYETRLKPYEEEWIALASDSAKIVDFPEVKKWLAGRQDNSWDWFPGNHKNEQLLQICHHAKAQFKEGSHLIFDFIDDQLFNLNAVFELPSQSGIEYNIYHHDSGRKHAPRLLDFPLPALHAIDCNNSTGIISIKDDLQAKKSDLIEVVKVFSKLLQEFSIDLTSEIVEWDNKQKKISIADLINCYKRSTRHIRNIEDYKLTSEALFAEFKRATHELRKIAQSVEEIGALKKIENHSQASIEKINNNITSHERLVATHKNALHQELEEMKPALKGIYQAYLRLSHSKDESFYNAYFDSINDIDNYNNYSDLVVDQIKTWISQQQMKTPAVLKLEDQLDIFIAVKNDDLVYYKQLVSLYTNGSYDYQHKSAIRIFQVQDLNKANQNNSFADFDYNPEESNAADLRQVALMPR